MRWRRTVDSRPRRPTRARSSRSAMRRVRVTSIAPISSRRAKSRREGRERGTGNREPSLLAERIGLHMTKLSGSSASVHSSRFPVPAVLSLVLLAACNDVAPIFNRPGAQTAHERYAVGLAKAGLDSTALGRDWLAAAQSSIRAPLTVAVPFRETGYFAASEARAVGYAIALRDG